MVCPRDLAGFASRRRPPRRALVSRARRPRRAARARPRRPPNASRRPRRRPRSGRSWPPRRRCRGHRVKGRQVPGPADPDAGQRPGADRARGPRGAEAAHQRLRQGRQDLCPADSPALAEFTQALLAEGTTKRDKATYDAQVDPTGGAVMSEIDNEIAGVTADMLARDAAFGFNAVAEQLMSPALPETSVKKIKDLLLQGIDQEKSSPFGLSARMAARAIYGEESPYSRPFATPAQNDGLGCEQAVGFPCPPLSARQHDAGGRRRHQPGAGPQARGQGLRQVEAGRGGAGAAHEAARAGEGAGGLHRRQEGQRPGVGAGAGRRAGHR